MKNYLAFMILSIFLVSCYQDDDVQIQNETVETDGRFYDYREVAGEIIHYQEPDIAEESSDDPPPKQVGGNGARPAPQNGAFSINGL